MNPTFEAMSHYNRTDLLFVEYGKNKNYSEISYSTFDNAVKPRICGSFTHRFLSSTLPNRHYQGHIVDLTITCPNFTYCNPPIDPVCGACVPMLPKPDPAYWLYLGYRVHNCWFRNNFNNWYQIPMDKFNKNEPL